MPASRLYSQSVPLLQILTTNIIGPLIPIWKHQQHPNEKRPETTQQIGIPRPTSPHKFHQIAISDIVTQVPDIYSVFTLALLGPFEGFLRIGIDWTPQGTWERVIFAVTTTASWTRPNRARVRTTCPTPGRNRTTSRRARASAWATFTAL